MAVSKCPLGEGRRVRRRPAVVTDLDACAVGPSDLFPSFSRVLAALS